MLTFGAPRQKAEAELSGTGRDGTGRDGASRQVPQRGQQVHGLAEGRWFVLPTWTPGTDAALVLY